MGRILESPLLKEKHGKTYLKCTVPANLECNQAFYVDSVNYELYFSGSGTFLLLAYKSLQWGKRYFMRQKIQTGMIIVWALRSVHFKILVYMYTHGFLFSI